MSRPLKDTITSDFFKSKNKLHPKDGNIVRVFVENEDDIPFWKYVFSCFDMKTKISPASHNLKRGKEIALQNANKAGKYLLICVDSDYDFLLQNSTTTSNIINNNPYVFQTYTYSIENYFCVANGFDQIIVDTTQNDDEIIDFVTFFEEYSKLILELFCYSVFYRKLYLIENQVFEIELNKQKALLSNEDFEQWTNDNRPTEIFTISDFIKAIQFPQNLDLSNNGATILAKINTQIQTKLSDLPRLTNENFNETKSQLAKLNILPTQVYLFIQGHFIERSTERFLNYVCKSLVRFNYEKIATSEATNEEKSNRRNAYRKHLESFNLLTILRTHKYYENTFWYKKIRTDIQEYIRTHF